MNARGLTASIAALGIAMLAAPGCGGGGGEGGSTGGGGGSTSSTVGSTGSGGASASSASSGSATGSSVASSSASSSSGSGGPSCQYPADYPDGSVTFYTLSMGSTAVNCGFEVLGQNPDVVAHVPLGGGQYFGAMNTADYDTAATCGACVQVDRDDGKSVTVTIVDQCPTATNPVCTPGHIDLSKAAFLQIGLEQEGYLGTTHGGAFGKISWRYVPCPTSENVSFRLKEPDNQFWNQILVEGHRHPIAMLEVEVGGVWQAGVRQSYNYWQVGNGNLGPAPYHVRVTDVNGSTIEATLDLKGGDQPSNQQFPACR